MTYLATWGAPGPQVFHAPVIVIAPPGTAGAVDSPRIADTAFRRKKKRQQIEAITRPARAIDLIAVGALGAPSIAKKPDFRTLAELSGKSVEAFRAEIDQEIAQLLAEQQERDDEEAFTLILSTLEG